MKLASFIVIGLVACAAPRDPELERQVLIARAAKSAPPDEGSVAPEVPTETKPSAKSYSGEEIAKILDNVPGEGVLHAVIETAQGTLTCKLDERAPQIVANFVGLATGQIPTTAKQGPFYDGLTFHRIVTDFVIQTGNPTGKTNAGPGWRLARDNGANDLFKDAGVMAAISEGDQVHGSQFFITAKADTNLGNTYSAFGKCADVELVKAISRAEKKAGGDGKSPASPLVITALKIERRPDAPVAPPP